MEGEVCSRCRMVGLMVVVLKVMVALDKGLVEETPG